MCGFGPTLGTTQAQRGSPRDCPSTRSSLHPCACASCPLAHNRSALSYGFAWVAAQASPFLSSVKSVGTNRIPNSTETSDVIRD